jgi:hypothetical protein
MEHFDGWVVRAWKGFDPAAEDVDYGEPWTGQGATKGRNMTMAYSYMEQTIVHCAINWSETGMTQSTSVVFVSP